MRGGLYSRHKVQEYWIVDLSAKSIEIAVHDGSTLATVAIYQPGARVRSQLFPEVKVNVGELFRE